MLNSAGSRTKTQPPETSQEVDIEPFTNTASVHLKTTPPKELSICIPYLSMWSAERDIMTYLVKYFTDFVIPNELVG